MSARHGWHERFSLAVCRCQVPSGRVQEVMSARHGWHERLFLVCVQVPDAIRNGPRGHFSKAMLGQANSSRLCAGA